LAGSDLPLSNGLADPPSVINQHFGLNAVVNASAHFFQLRGWRILG